LVAGPTLYKQLATELRKAIISGEYPPGSKLPTEQVLLRRHGVSRNTVRLALRELVNEGLITRAPRRGTIVREPRPLTIAPQAELADPAGGSHWDRDAFARAVLADGRNPKYEITVGPIVPPEEVARRLRLRDKEPALARRRVRYVDGEPYNIYDSYFPHALVRDSEIARTGDIQRGANRVLAELGHPQVRTVDEISSRMPTPEERTRLHIAPGTPVIIYVRTGHDPADVPVRVAVSILPADKHVIHYEFGSH
jgi:GntR family transcriptional regulator